MTTELFLEGIQKSLSHKLQTPYRINLLDEVHIHDDSGTEVIRERRKVCENAHTRILRRLLEFRLGTSYPIMRSFLEMIADISGNPGWKSIPVNNPLFIPEASCGNTSGRIDLLVEEKGSYAIIFENKINDAVEQESQLARYISHLNNDGYSLENIYIVYLTSSNEACGPSEESWSYQEKELFARRFVNLSYRDGILPWLSDTLSPFVSGMTQQPYLQSAVSQYICYLQGKFFLIESENNAIIEILHEYFKDGDDNTILHSIYSKVTEIKYFYKKNQNSGKDILKTAKLTINGLESLKRQRLKNLVGDTDFPEYTGSKVIDRLVDLGYSVSINGHPYVLYIGHYNYFFCSIFDLHGSGFLKKDCQDAGLWNLFSVKQRNHYLHTVITPGKDESIYDYTSACNHIRQVLVILSNYLSTK